MAFLHKNLAKFEDVRANDGTDLTCDGPIEVGKDILTPNEEGDYDPAPNGEYDLGDRVIVVEAGKIIEIREVKPDDDPEPDPDPDPAKDETEASKKFAAIKEAFSMTYDERIKKIVAAVIASGYTEYGYCIEASDESVVWAYYDYEGNEEHFVQFTLTWNGEDVTVSDPVEVVTTFVPKDSGTPAPAASTEETEALKAENEALKAENAELKEKVNTMAAVPPVEPAKLDKEEKPLAGQFIDNARRRQ